ncbi:MAG: hypothetical protein RL757_1011 [Bacteroidota bacterium]|jgi:AcrR family transcriptional regulator
MITFASVLSNNFVKHLFDMPKLDSDTKDRILEAAEKVFHTHGFKGARTTMIAEMAGISRTMLHYHYSTKEALFHEVLNQTLNTVFLHIKKLFDQDRNLEALIAHLVDVIADLMEAKPHLPSFIINILNESPEMAALLATNPEDTIPSQLDELLVQAKQNGKIDPDFTGEDLILNIYALCSVAYLGEPYIKLKEKRDEEGMKQFHRLRRPKIRAFILGGVFSKTI